MTDNADIARIIHQEKTLRFKHFDEGVAWELGSRLRDHGTAHNLPIVADVRVPGRQLFYCALPGSSPDNPEWVRRKSNVVMRYYKSSYRVGLELEAKGQTLDEARGVSPLDFAPHGGSFPITIEEAGVIGTVTVSGLPQRDDHGLVVEVLAGWLRHDIAGLKLVDVTF
ncbi:heme-degrading domain-containing protein [soil metagenome]